MTPLIYLLQRCHAGARFVLEWGPVRGRDGEHLPIRACLRVPDEHLEFWGRIYQDNPAIARRGILFESFIQDPVVCLAAIGRLDAFVDRAGPDYRDLLGAQAAAASRIDWDTIELETQRQEQDLDRRQTVRRNGAYIEPLHSTTWPRRAPRRTANQH